MPQWNTGASAAAAETLNMLETNKEERRGNLSIVSDVCHVLRLEKPYIQGGRSFKMVKKVSFQKVTPS